MARTAKRPDVYQLITERIIKQLDQGVVPWRKPWVGGEPPQSLERGRPYRGINVFLLACTPYDSPYWVTFKQAQRLGGSVNKGERGFPVVLWKWLDKKESKGNPTAERIPLLRYFTVFNAKAQCDGLAVPDTTARPGDWDSHAAAESIAAGFDNGPSIQHGGGGAYYRPATDSVTLPDRDRFPRADEYYSTLFHELGHATGHASRLNRSGVTDINRFGSHAYSKEELVAEMTAAYLSAEAGIVEATLDNSAAYIGSWLKRLRNDKRLVIQAAAQAQRAMDHILGRNPVEAAAPSV